MQSALNVSRSLVRGSVPSGFRARLHPERGFARESTIWIVAFLLLALPPAGSAGVRSAADPAGEKIPGAAPVSTPMIEPLLPPSGDGYGYRLVYTVDASVEVMWRFKTDFDGDFFHTNQYIRHHRLIQRQQDRVITEEVYSRHPGVPFRWETVVHPEKRLLTFVLLSPGKSGQRFHNGWIQLVPVGGRTRVIHVAYFDFTGAFFWVHYPFDGGMKAFLNYMARWEQETVVRLRSRYEDP